MSICITIASNQLEMVAEKLDNSKFKYKFLYESDDKYKTIENYKLNLLNECLMFTGLSHQIRTNRMKIKADNKLKDACKRFFEKALNENNVSNAQSDTENEKYYFCSTLFEWDLMTM